MISLREARVKRRLGEREPSRCMWCSHLGRAWRNGWSGDLHIVGRDQLREVKKGSVVLFDLQSVRCKLVASAVGLVGCRIFETVRPRANRTLR